MKDLIKKFDEFQNKNILIVGDAIIDHYIDGSTSKISPDAPVPLVDISNEQLIVGATGVFIKYILKMKANIEIITCVGKDFEGQFFKQEMKKMGVKTDGIIEFNTCTPKISRVLSQDQQILRLEKKYKFDQEEIKEINQIIESIIEKQIKICDVIVILDYDQGFLNPILISNILNLAKKNNKKIIARSEDTKYFLYQNVYLMQMNRNIARIATGIQPLNETCMHIMGTKLLNEVHCSGVFIPWVEEDSYYFIKNEVKVISTLLKHRAETYMGIGSAMIAFLTLMSSSNASLENCIKVAHLIGSLMTFNKWNNFNWSIDELKKAVESGKIPS